LFGRSRWQTQATEELKVTQTANFPQDALYSLRVKLSTRDAARFLGVSASMLAKLRISSGGGPLFSKLGRRVIYDVIDLEEWSASRKRRHTSEYSSRQISAQKRATPIATTLAGESR
jgi:Helix-turn-helix domain